MSSILDTRLFVVLFMLVALLTGFTQAGCIQTPSASSGAASASLVTTDLEGRYAVALDYNAGTGYQWECSVEPEGVFDIIGIATRDASEDKNIGGQLRDYVNIIARAPGKATLTCELKRSWEEGVEPVEVQTFVFEVNGGLSMKFVPEESSFVNEPVETYSA